jgi:hypothetical protein
MSASEQNTTKKIYWHRELPPLEADVLGEYTVEAVSGRAPGTLSRRDEVWDRCYAELMSHTQLRLEQEISRLGGDCAHVLGEQVDTRHDDARGEVWLRGRFTYVLYRLPRADEGPYFPRVQNR